MSTVHDLAPATRDLRLVEVLDRLLDRGIVIRGELWLTVADVELVFIGADILIASADRMQTTREMETPPS